MSVKEKQDNEEFKVISMDQEVIKGDANKLKLLITSYAAIMEVQDTYMQEEIKTKEAEKTEFDEMTTQALLNAKKDVLTLKQSMEKDYIQKELDNMYHELENINNLLCSKESCISELNSIIAQKSKEIDIKSEEIVAIKSSRSYKIIEKLRKLINKS